MQANAEIGRTSYQPVRPASQQRAAFAAPDAAGNEPILPGKSTVTPSMSAASPNASRRTAGGGIFANLR